MFFWRYFKKGVGGVGIDNRGLKLLVSINFRDENVVNRCDLKCIR